MNTRRMMISASRRLYNFPSKVFGVAQNVPDYRSSDNPQVFFQVSKDGTQIGNLTFEVSYIKFFDNIFNIVIRKSLP